MSKESSPHKQQPTSPVDPIVQSTIDQQQKFLAPLVEKLVSEETKYTDQVASILSSPILGSIRDTAATVLQTYDLAKEPLETTKHVLALQSQYHVQARKELAALGNAFLEGAPYDLSEGTELYADVWLASPPKTALLEQRIVSLEDAFNELKQKVIVGFE
ncbi:MAG: hypothetical protein AB1352_05315 [Patescibacteria group bacterium]